MQTCSATAGQQLHGVLSVIVLVPALPGVCIRRALVP